MSSTLLTLKNLVYTNLGRDSSDSAAALIVPATINYAISAIAAIFKPAELHTNNNISITPGNPSVSISSIDYLDIIRVYNSTDSIEMLFIPFELWEILVPTQTVVKYYSLFGDTLYVKMTPTGDKTFILYYLKHPTTLSNDTDTVDFDHFDSYIVAIASAITFAAFEEGDTVDIWAKVAEVLNIPFLKASQMREIVAGKTALLESTISGALSSVAGAGQK